MGCSELRGVTATDSGTKIYYVFAGNQRIAALEVPSGTAVPDAEFTYYHSDHLGGTALTTDADGFVSQLYDYYPYGSELLNESPDDGLIPSPSPTVPHSFTDKELDSDLGLYYFEARWYDSDIGRFASWDPAQMDDRLMKIIQDPQQLNYYSYSRNNPVNIVDPSGEFAFVPFLVAAAAVAFTAWDVYDVAQKTVESGPIAGAATAAFAFVNPIPNKATKFISEVPIIREVLTSTATKIDNIVGNMLSDFKQTGLPWSYGTQGNSQRSLYNHFKAHGDEFGVSTIEEYYSKANNFIENGATDVFEQTRKNGSIDTIYQNTNTGEKAIVSEGGEIRSYYSTNKTPEK